FTQRLGAGVCCFGVTQLGLWAQDDIALTKTVNLALGLREEAQTNTSSIWNLAPRAQLEWSPAAMKRTTLRVGAGIFHPWLNPADIEQTVRVDGVHQQDIFVKDPPFPGASAPGSQLLPAGRYLLAPDLQLPYLLRASIGIDRSQGPWVFHADYTQATGT